MSPAHLINLKWVPPEQGGRATLPFGPVYATIAHFEDDPLSESFSVLIEFPEHSARADMTAGLRLLAPDRLPDVRGVSREPEIQPGVLGRSVDQRFRRRPSRERHRERNARGRRVGARTGWTRREGQAIPAGRATEAARELLFRPIEPLKLLRSFSG